MAATARAPLDLRARQARARALASVIWLVGAAALSALLIAGHDTTPSGSAMAVLGGGLGVGVLFAFALLAVNASLRRDPDRVDARGAADMLCLVTAVVAVLTVILVLAFGSGAGFVLVTMVIVGLVMFGALLAIGLWTRSSAQRRTGVPQP
jgi:FtsH-binding integral membrane protein